MKMIALAAAGLVAASALTPTPAAAQWNGRGYYGHDRGWNDGRWDDRRGWRGDRRGWRDDRRGWRGDRRDWNRGWRGGRNRVVCQWVRTPWGPDRQCFRR